MKKLLRIFHLDSERSFRGGERQLLYLAGYLRQEGHDNVIVCRAATPLNAEARRRGFNTLHLPFWGEWDPVSAWRLHKAAAIPPNISIFHAHTGHTALLASMASKIGGEPWIVHRRVDFRLRSAVSRRWKYDGADRIISVSENIRSVLIQDGVSAQRISVIPDCLPISDSEASLAGHEKLRLSPATPEEKKRLRLEFERETGLPASVPWIGNFAALVPHKDHETLLNAAALVLRYKPESRFIILGEGPLREKLEDLAARLGISESVYFAGYRKDAVAWMKSLDLYVQSSWGEGMGSVLLEAMACAIPIVATAAGGIPEVIDNGATGLLVNPVSPDALGKAILESLDLPSQAQARSARALAGLHRFGLCRLGREVSDIYQGLGRTAALA